MKARNVLIAALVFLAWLALLPKLYGSFPPFVNAAMELELSKMQPSVREVITATHGSVENYAAVQAQHHWTKWTVTLVALFFGLASASLAWKQVAKWKVWVIVMSGLFVVGYIFDLSQTAGGVAFIGMIIDIKIALANAILKSSGRSAFIVFAVTETLLFAAFLAQCLAIILAALKKSNSPA